MKRLLGQPHGSCGEGLERSPECSDRGAVSFIASWCRDAWCVT